MKIYLRSGSGLTLPTSVQHVSVCVLRMLLYFSICPHIVREDRICMPRFTRGGQRTACRIQFDISPSTIRIPRSDFRSCFNGKSFYMLNPLASLEFMSLKTVLRTQCNKYPLNIF